MENMGKKIENTEEGRRYTRRVRWGRLSGGGGHKTWKREKLSSQKRERKKGREENREESECEE